MDVAVVVFVLIYIYFISSNIMLSFIFRFTLLYFICAFEYRFMYREFYIVHTLLLFYLFFEKEEDFKGVSKEIAMEFAFSTSLSHLSSFLQLTVVINTFLFFLESTTFFDLQCLLHFYSANPYYNNNNNNKKLGNY